MEQSHRNRKERGNERGHFSRSNYRSKGTGMCYLHHRDEKAKLALCLAHMTINYVSSTKYTERNNKK